MEIRRLRVKYDPHSHFMYTKLGSQGIMTLALAIRAGRFGHKTGSGTFVAVLSQIPTKCAIQSGTSKGNFLFWFTMDSHDSVKNEIPQTN